MLHRIFSTVIAATLLFAFIGTAGQKQDKKPELSKTQKGNPVVIMKTSMGTMTIELFQEKAPISVKNFLTYVDDKYYDNTVFHRVIKSFMIQCGGFSAGDPIKQKSTREQIKNESENGMKNDRGTLAMARTQEPNSATSQFFINVVDNAFLNRSERDAGYAVFGKVIEGMDVVDKIREVKTGNAAVIALSGTQEMKTTFQDVPKTAVIIESVRRVEKK